MPRFLSYECFSCADDRLSSFHFLSYQNFFIKRVLSLVLYKIDFRVFKFKNPFLKPKLNLLNFMIKKNKINTHINHLVQVFLINMTLKWHYINMFDKIDSFSIN